MESYILDICGRDHGYLFQNRSFVPLHGPVLTISNSSRHQNQAVSFVHAAWDNSGNRMLAGDCNGNIFMLEPQKNRFWLLHHMSFSSTFITFTNDNEQDVIVALADCSVVSLKSESKVVKNRFNHHTSCVSYISFNKTGNNVLSCSQHQAILWNLETFDVVRILSLKKNVDIVKVFFIPNTEIIVSSFKDSSVFLWNCESFSCMSHFKCKTETSLLNVKAIDVSNDGKLLVCAGKGDWFFVWDVTNSSLLHTVLLPENVISIKQLHFLSPEVESSKDYILALLSQQGHIHIYNLRFMEHLYKLSMTNDDKIISFQVPRQGLKLMTISLQGQLKTYEMDGLLESVHEEQPPQVEKKQVQHREKQTQTKEKQVATKKKEPSVDKEKLIKVVKNFEEYPEKYRFFIWSNLLDLPTNNSAFNLLYQESLNVNFFDKDYPIRNPGVKRTYERIMSMLVSWYPVLQHIEYFQTLVYPFIRILHKNVIMCFEILITFISNWCQNWFIYCPFQPFNILCCVENVLAFHDRDLFVYFLEKDISTEIYAWPLLHTVFSEVFNKHDWLKLWDNIFSNSLSFLLYATAAYSICIREELLRCQSLQQFKTCFQRHAIPVTVLLKKTYHMQKTTPENVDPGSAIGSFNPIPKDTYPAFIQAFQMDIDLQTLTKKDVINEEVQFIKKKEEEIQLTKNYLLELQELQMLRRKLLLESMELNTDSLAELNRKLQELQSIIQDSLASQVSTTQSKMEDKQLPCPGQMVTKTHLFHFKDYMDRLRRKEKF